MADMEKVLTTRKVFEAPYDGYKYETFVRVSYAGISGVCRCANRQGRGEAE
jgi:hypothetical protein